MASKHARACVRARARVCVCVCVCVCARACAQDGRTYTTVAPTMHAAIVATDPSDMRCLPSDAYGLGDRASLISLFKHDERHHQ
jgi:hypothetical protein